MCSNRSKVCVTMIRERVARPFYYVIVDEMKSVRLDRRCAIVVNIESNTCFWQRKCRIAADVFVMTNIGRINA